LQQRSLPALQRLAFEEFPTSEPSLPLFGHLYSLIALKEYVQYFEDNDVLTILRGGLRGLKENLPKYDLGKWLIFDLHPSKRCASPGAILKNCTLLKILATLTEDDDYAAVAQKWFTYTESPTCKRYYFFRKLWGKIRLRVSAKKYGIDRKYLKVAPR
ncbi:MAG: D-glucuronyl C5-epimerase family protein, partial [bacterium]